jgi:hypothetical protein
MLSILYLQRGHHRERVRRLLLQPLRDRIEDLGVDRANRNVTDAQQPEFDFHRIRECFRIVKPP